MVAAVSPAVRTPEVYVHPNTRSTRSDETKESDIIWSCEKNKSVYLNLFWDLLFEWRRRASFAARKARPGAAAAAGVHAAAAGRTRNAVILRSWFIKKWFNKTGKLEGEFAVVISGVWTARRERRRRRQPLRLLMIRSCFGSFLRIGAFILQIKIIFYYFYWYWVDI